MSDRMRCQRVCIVVAGVLAVKWLPKIGGWTGYIGGLWINVLSTFMIGLGGFTGAGIGYYSCWFAVVVMVPIHENRLSPSGKAVTEVSPLICRRKSLSELQVV